MTLWIIFAPLIILFNSFALGKVFKRYNQHFKSFLCLTSGFVTFVAGLMILIIPLLLFTITFNILLYVILIYQIALLVLYAFNWRWFFITYKFNYKYVFLFLIALLFISLGFILSIDYDTPNINFLLDGNFDFLENISKVPSNEIYVFTIGKNYFKIDFVWYFYAIFIYIFNIKDVLEIQYFYTYITLIIFSIIASNLIMSIFSKSDNIFNFKNIFIVAIASFGISFFSFAFIELLWVLLLTLFLFNIHTSKQHEIRSKVSMLLINSIILCGVLFDINFIIIGIVLNIAAISISYQYRKEDATNYNIMMMFSTLLLISICFNNEYYDGFNFIGFILLLIILIFYSSYTFYKTSSIAYSTGKKIDYFMYDKIKFISVFIILVIVCITIIFFLLGSNFIISSYFWKIYNIGNILLAENSLWFNTINIVFWITNALFFFVAIFKTKIVSLFLNKNFLKKNKLKIKEDAGFNTTLIIIFIFWNPLAIDLFAKLNSTNILGFTANFQIIFFAMVVPVLLNILKQTNNDNKISIFNSSFIGIILIVNAIFIVALNVA